MSAATGRSRPERQIALLRGINVGRAKRVSMADLKALFEELGYRDVTTLLQSGNVVFSGRVGASTAARLEKAMVERLGVSSRFTLLSASELVQAIKENPIEHLATNPSRHMIAILSDPADRKRLTPLSREDWSPEAFALGKRVAYFWCPEGILESRVAKALDRSLGDRVTTRNWTTLNKLSELASK
jgi:uncharacterized protein (DUF1697 family)